MITTITTTTVTPVLLLLLLLLILLSLILLLTTTNTLLHYYTLPLLPLLSLLILLLSQPLLILVLVLFLLGASHANAQGELIVKKRTCLTISTTSWLHFYPGNSTLCWDKGKCNFWLAEAHMEIRSINETVQFMKFRLKNFLRNTCNFTRPFIIAPSLKFLNRKQSNNKYSS